VNRHPDIVGDQSGTGSEENGRIGPGRLDHRLATFFGPDLGEVTEEARRECLPSTDRPAVQVAGLTGLPLGRLADFSYVRHLFSPDNFHTAAWRSKSGLGWRLSGHRKAWSRPQIVSDFTKRISDKADELFGPGPSHVDAIRPKSE
jgi:hypothetical protein